MSKSFIARAAAALLLTLAPVVANALVVTLEPDDYSAGTELTNVSPYVTLQAVTPSPFGTDVSGIYADDDGASGDPDYVAPTGNLTFGNHGFFVFGSGPKYGGFSLTFHQAVTNISLLANSEYPPGLLALWAAYDRDGNIIGNGSAGGSAALGETFDINIGLSDVWSVILGGDDSTAAINFDRLMFEVDEVVSVPEPSGLLLLLSGLLMIALRKHLVPQASNTGINTLA